MSPNSPRCRRGHVEPTSSRLRCDRLNHGVSHVRCASYSYLDAVRPDGVRATQSNRCGLPLEPTPRGCWSATPLRRDFSRGYGPRTEVSSLLRVSNRAPHQQNAPNRVSPSGVGATSAYQSKPFTHLGGAGPGDCAVFDLTGRKSCIPPRAPFSVLAESALPSREPYARLKKLVHLIRVGGKFTETVLSKPASHPMHSRKSR